MAQTLNSDNSRAPEGIDSLNGFRVDGEEVINSTGRTLSPTVANGTPGTGVTAVEYGDGINHVTRLTIANTTAFGAIAGGANLALGRLIYTFPAGVQIVRAAYMSVALDEDDGNVTADTPDVGLGTTVASGANALLSANAAFENVLTGQTAADCNGTATVATVSNQILNIAAAGNKTLYLNIADGWAASGENDLRAAGTVVIEWTQMV